MALAAARLNVPRGKDWFFAGPFAVVRLSNRRSRPLAAVTDDAAESIQRVRNDRMFAEGLLSHVAKTGLIQPQVACSTAVDDTEVR
jgi:hypothetical protein